MVILRLRVASGAVSGPESAPTATTWPLEHTAEMGSTSITRCSGADSPDRMSTLPQFAETLRTQYSDRGIGATLERAPRFLRQRLPVSLWPPLLIDPRNGADEVVRLPEKPSLSVTYDSPFADAPPRQLANFLGTISAPENAVYVYHDATVEGRYPVALIDGRYLLPSWLGVDTAFFLHQQKFLKRDVPLSRLLRRRLFGTEPDRHLDSAFLLNDERGSYRYGWFHETLPKLRWFEEYCEATGESPTLILNSPLRAFQRETLAWMGYEPEDWLEHGPETTSVDRLAVAPHPIRLEGNPSSGFASEVGWAGRRIVENAPDVEREFGDRIYVSRADAARRRVRNEDAVVDALDELGFERYEPGRLTLAEQVRLFAGADVVVGLHGLAYVNLMFCDAETALLELFAEDGIDESYFVLANELGLTYDCLVCESIHEGRNQRPINKDVIVDTDRLVTMVEHLIETREGTAAHSGVDTHSESVR